MTKSRKFWSDFAYEFCGFNRTNYIAAREFLFNADVEKRMESAMGSSHNHQAWTGGYIDHIRDCFSIADTLHKAMEGKYNAFNYMVSLDDAFLVLFLHDIEKLFKDTHPFNTKKERAEVRLELIRQFGFELNDEQFLALKYVEGEGDDYSSNERKMNELGAFCHMCDVASARIFHSEMFSNQRQQSGICCQ